MKFSSTVLLGFLASSDCFMVQQQRTNHASLMLASSDVELGLTPELKKITDAFGSISDEQVRYKQLLYMAQHTKEANGMPESSKTPENKVPGCLSTVYVDGTAEFSEEAGDYIINFVGDSDGLLTRGLLALLVRWVIPRTRDILDYCRTTTIANPLHGLPDACRETRLQISKRWTPSLSRLLKLNNP
jgi:sulfur transfer protein SufE